MIFEKKLEKADEWNNKPMQVDFDNLWPDLLSHKSVHVDMAHKTPQFWLLFVVLCFNVTAGIGVIGVAKTMVKDVFSGIPGAPQPWIYVTLVSLFNMLGR